MDSDNTPAPTIPSKIGRFFIRLFLGPPSLMLRVKFFLTGCLFPLGCFGLVLAGFAGPPDALWQSGELYDYIALLLWHPGCLIPFLPLIVYCLLSLASWIFWPQSSCFLFIRLGVYLGALVAAQYLFFVAVASQGVTFIAAIIVGPILAFLMFAIDLFARRSEEHGWLQAPVFIGILGLFVAAMGFSQGNLMLMAPILVAIATPVLCFITYLRAAVMVAREHSLRPTERKSLLYWLFAVQGVAAAWFASWKFAIDRMLFEYAKLPPEPPPACYVSAAAARRHAWLFREPHCGVSLQTKRLKFLEIALRCAAPRLHALLRRIYDRLGPPLAAQCKRSSWLADLSYLALLPLEGAAILLRRLLQIPAQKISRLYETPIIQSRFPH